MKNNSLFLITLLLFINSINAQKEQRQLIDSSYSYLMKSFYGFRRSDAVKAKLYANAYFNKAKRQNKVKALLDGAYFKSIVYKKDSLYLDFVDSLINIHIKKPNKLLPALIYEDKYRFYFEKEQNSLSLKSLIKAINYTEITENDSLKANYNFKLAIFKQKLKEYDQALKLFIESKSYYKNNKLYNKSYVSLILNLSSLLIEQKKIKKAFNELDALELVLVNYNMERFNGYIHMQRTKAFFIKSNYISSLKYGEKSLKSLYSDGNNRMIQIVYYYMAMASEKINRKENVIKYSKKIDSIQNINNLNNHTIPYAYNILRSFYKSKGDIEKEIFYLEKLIVAERQFTKIYTDLNDGMIKRYNIPKLTKEKKLLINKLEKDINIEKYYKYSLGIISIISIAGITLFYRRQKKMKDQFNLVVNNKSKIFAKKDENTTKINLSENVIKSILIKLNTFESEYEFLNQTITLNSLAKEFETNANYLSKIINHYKENNFSKYLSNLRINYILESLKEDEKIRKYTIKAIAEEAGFKNTESFSNAFQLKTGLKPSYYIRQLNKKLN